MSCKVVIIGGGSYTWTPILAKDIFLKEELKGSELVLVDIDAEAAELVRKYLLLINDLFDSRWKISVDSLESALDAADYVCVSISTGGFESMEHDYKIPEEYGVYHSVGDTVGPAGISRSLRNIPVFMDIAGKMERLCPNAWMIHVTNPLSQLTRAVCKASSIKCVGLCHNYAVTMAFLADFLDSGYEDMDALCVGVNHYTWLKDTTCRGRSVAENLSVEKYLDYERSKGGGQVLTNTSDDEVEKASHDKAVLKYYLNFELYELFGFFPVGACAHVAENFPYYLNSEKAVKKHHIYRKGVLPKRKLRKEENKKDLIDIIDGKKQPVNLTASREGFANIVASLHSGIPCRAIVAMPNSGQITGLPRDVIVETQAMVGGSGIFPIMSGDIPAPLAGAMQMVIDEQECTVEAALAGDRKKVLQAMAISPVLHDKNCIRELTEKLLNAQKDYLPQFKFC